MTSGSWFQPDPAAQRRPAPKWVSAIPLALPPGRREAATAPGTAFLCEAGRSKAPGALSPQNCQGHLLGQNLLHVATNGNGKGPKK